MAKVTFEVSVPFTSSTDNKLYGKGEYEIESRMAIIFKRMKKGRILNFNLEDESEEIFEQPEELTPEPEESKENAEQVLLQEIPEVEIPANFPYRKRLVEAGVANLSILLSYGKDDFAKLGFNNAQINKIGIAIESIDV